MESADIARVRLRARALADAHPGRSVELRIPPYAAVQIAAQSSGPTHRRGTPPTVVEMSGDTFLALLDHEVTWAQAMASHAVSASGAHADLGWLFEESSDHDSSESE